MSRTKWITMTKNFSLIVCAITLVACTNQSIKAKDDTSKDDPQKTQSHKNESDGGSYWTEEKMKNAKPVDLIDNN